MGSRSDNIAFTNQRSAIKRRLARRAISCRREPPEDARRAKSSTIPALPAPHRNAETSRFRKRMRKINGGGQMISQPVAIKGCSFRSEVVFFCLQAATAALVGLRGETSERHRQTQRYQSSSFVLRGSYGLSATSGLRGPTLCTPTIKPIDVMPHEIIGHQRLLSERSTDAPPPA